MADLQKDLIFEVEVWADGVRYDVEITAYGERDARKRAKHRVKVANPEAEEIKIVSCKQRGQQLTMFTDGQQIPFFVDGPDDATICQ